MRTAPPSCSSPAATTRYVRCGTDGRCGRTDRSPWVTWLATGTESPSSTARWGGQPSHPHTLTPSVHQLRSSLPVALLFLFENPLFCRFQGDARYLISNSKDQSIKLWDIRKFSPKEGLAASRQAVTQQNWDYRWQQVPQRGVGGGGCWGGGCGGGWRVVVSNGCLSVLSSPEEAPAGGGHLGDDLPGSRRPPHAHPLPLLPRVQHRPEVHLLRLLHGQDRQ